MATTTLKATTLRELNELATNGHPVLSVYVDLDPSSFPTPGTRSAQLSALLAAAGAGEADTRRVRELLEASPELLQVAPGLAVFSCAESDILKTVPLPGRVAPLAVCDTVPWLEPLVAMLASENWGVIVASRDAARLFRGGPRSLVEFARIDDEVHKRHARGGWSGWSQSRFQRGIEEQVAQHVRHLTEDMLKAHRRSPFEQLVIVAADELWPMVDAALHPELRGRLAGRVALDLENAPTTEIADEVASVMERARREQERGLIDRLESTLGIGGRATAGLDDVLGTLREGRVELLMVADAGQLPAGRCPRCDDLFAWGAGTCPRDGAPMSAVNAVEHAIHHASRQGAETMVMQYEADALHTHGSIAALLRW
jgi:peptide subunit release factor 1 (eRF1)